MRVEERKLIYLLMNEGQVKKILDYLVYIGFIKGRDDSFTFELL